MGRSGITTVQQAIGRRALAALADALSASACVACVACAACVEGAQPCDATHALDGFVDTVAVVQGGRAFVDVPRHEGVAVHIEGLAPGFSAREDAGTFIIGAPYGVTGSVPARFVAACSDGTHDASSRTFTLVVRAPQVHRIGATGGPAPRTLAGATVVNNRVVVAGGLVRANAVDVALDDVWLLDLDHIDAAGAWTRLSVTGPPSPLRAAKLDDTRAVFLAADGHSFVLDTAQDGALLQVLDDNRPSDVLRGAFAALDGVLVSACGTGAHSQCNVASLAVDERARGTWTFAEPTGFSPAGRAGAAWGVDEEGHRLVLFGGARDDGLGHDTWSLDDAGASATFAHLAVKGEDPPGRVDSCGVVDPVGRRFFVFGGHDDNGTVADAYVLDLDHDDAARWHPVTLDGLPARTGCTAVYDANHARILVGFGSDGAVEHDDVYAIDL